MQHRVAGLHPRQEAPSALAQSVGFYVFSNSELERIFLTFSSLLKNHFLKISKLFVAESQEI